MIPSADLAMGIICLVIAFAGSIMNGFVIFLMITKKELRQQDYICFILNKGLFDFIFCVHLFMQAAVIFSGAPSTTPQSLAASLILIGLGYGTDFAELALASNRYTAIVHNDLYKKIYTKRSICLMCVLTWLMGFGLSLRFLLAGQMNRPYGGVCTLTLSSPAATASCDLPFTFALCAVFFFNYQIRQRLLQHQNQMMTSGQRSQLQLDQDLVRFITVIAFTPVVTQAPIVVFLTFEHIIHVPGWAYFGGFTVWLLWFIANPIITLRMVRPLRSEAMAMWRHIRGKNSVAPLSHGQLAAVSGSVSVRKY